MPIEIDGEEFLNMAKENQKFLQDWKFSKTAKPRKPEKRQAIIEAHVNSLLKKMPRPCRDGFWRFPKDIERFRELGELDKVPEIDW